MKPEGYKEILDFVKSRFKENNSSKNSYSVMVETLRRKLITPEVVCKRCGTQNDLTLDHIVPVNWLEQLMLPVGDLFDEENLEILCVKCNRFKGGRLDLAHPKTKELLLKFVSKI